MKKTAAALGVAFLLLTIIALIPVKVKATTYTNIFSAMIDASPIGSLVPSTGAFTSLASTSIPVSNAVLCTTSGSTLTNSGCVAQSDVTGSRSFGTVYTAGSVPLLVEVSASQAAVCAGSGFELVAYSASLPVAANGTGSCSNFVEWASVAFIVPAGANYQVTIANNGTTGTLNKWIEVSL